MSNRPLRIMIADDEEVIRLFVARVIEEMGYGCDFATDGQECLDRFERDGPYDILFLDLVMPRLDGEAVLREVHRRYPDTTVVMASVQDDEEAIRELLAEGATAYITKPMKPADIEGVLRRLLEIRGASSPE